MGGAAPTLQDEPRVRGEGGGGLTLAGGESLLAGWPPDVGGALAPIAGAFGGVTVGRGAGSSLGLLTGRGA